MKREHIFYRVYYNPTKPKFTIRRLRSQADPNSKTLLSNTLPQRLPLRSGQDILNWFFLGYREFCFSVIYWARMDAESESISAVMQSKLIDQVRRIARTSLKVPRNLRRLDPRYLIHHRKQHGKWIHPLELGSTAANDFHSHTLRSNAKWPQLTKTKPSRHFFSFMWKSSSRKSKSIGIVSLPTCSKMCQRP